MTHPSSYSKERRFGHGTSAWLYDRAGTALVISLAFIVLATICVLAFFSMATYDMRVESSRSHHAAADLLVASAGTYITEQFLREITDPLNSSSKEVEDVIIYTAIEGSKMAPQRLLTPKIEFDDASFLNLIRQSVAGADPNASPHRSDQASRDGRTVTASRWNAPVLLSGGFTDNEQLPCWIYVNRGTGVTSAPSQDVLGRFSYNVYDVGGLLNANAAGYPEGVDDGQVYRLKTTQAGADLTRLDAAVTASILTELRDFRNFEGATPDEYVSDALGSAMDGFLSVRSRSVDGARMFRHNYFTGRQDLLRYARAKNTSLQKVVPYLTHFSRSVNAPASVPVNPAGSNQDYAGAADDATSANRNLPNVRFPRDATVTRYNDDGVAETYQVRAGESFIQHRFSLRKLAAWLPAAGPDKAIPETVIQAALGLKWNAIEERWDYVGSTGDTPQSTIKTLAEIAAEQTSREPNFFELLKAGILSGSLGGASVLDNFLKYLGNDTTKEVHRNKDLQILRIGASMIDCADADNYPTVLALTYAGIAMEVAGIEDLPYLYSIAMVGLREQDTVGGINRLLSGDIVWIPNFYNPHQPSTSPGQAGPDAVRMEVATGILTQAEYNGGGAKYKQPMTKDLSALGHIEILRDDSGTQKGFAHLRDLPKPLRSSDPNDPQRLDKLAYFTHPDTGTHTLNIDAAHADVKGLLLFSWEKEYTYSGTGSDKKIPGAHNWYLIRNFNDSYCYVVRVQNLNFVMRFKTPKGTWKTYATIGGNEALPISGIDGMKTDGVTSPAQGIRCGRHFFEAEDSHDLNHAYHIFPYDPRSSRFSPVLARYWDNETLPPLNHPWGNNAGHSQLPPGVLPEAGKGETLVKDSFGSLPSNFADPDGVFRPADGFLEPSQSNPYRQTDNGKLVATHPSRPVILQRPFQSVGELGYVFRDTPWKSISFFDESSGDGALLELFSALHEPAITAGRVNLNSLQHLVKEALLSKSGQAVYSGSGLYNPAELPATTVTNMAKAFSIGEPAFAYNSGQPTIGMPRSLAELPLFMSSAPMKAIGQDPIKWRREAVVRALADVSQTRTWNLLIDVVAQSGRFPNTSTSSTNPRDFIVEGEQRCWISIAIDRPTARIIARQTESVSE